MRILITGSRDWTNTDTIRSAILSATSGIDPRTVTVVHGQCPTGADKIADTVARELGMTPEPHPADWSQGPKAGPVRNSHMVALGANICLAFIGDCTSARCKRTDIHPSHGASGCAAAATRAGIQVITFRSN